MSFRYGSEVPHRKEPSAGHIHGPDAQDGGREALADGLGGLVRATAGACAGRGWVVHGDLSAPNLIEREDGAVRFISFELTT